MVFFIAVGRTEEVEILVGGDAEKIILILFLSLWIIIFPVFDRTRT